MSDDYTIDPAAQVGHVHLKVSDLDRSLTFLRDVLGFEVQERMDDEAAFLSAGGYHHHIAANTWHSRGAGPRRDNEAGLSSFELVARDDEARAALSRRMAASGGDAGSAVDPWGNRITLRG